MLLWIRNLWDKNRQVFLYLMCSVIAALVESGIGWIFLRIFPFHITIINTMAIFFGAVIHYFLTSVLVFKIKKNAASVVVYVLSFAIGVLLQNLVIWLFYDFLLKTQTQGVRYAVSKALSLAIPFFVVYFIRKKLNERLARKETDPSE